MKDLKELKEKYLANSKELEGIIAAAEKEERQLTEEEQAKFDDLTAECEKLDVEIKNLERIQSVQLRADAYSKPDETMKQKPQAVSPAQPTEYIEGQLPVNDPVAEKIVIPASAKRWSAGNLVSFKGDDAELRAYKAGQWLLAAAGFQRPAKWCAEHGIGLEWKAASQSEGTNTAGGYLVPDFLDRDIIDLKNQYGVFRQNVRVRAMTSDTLKIPRRTSGLTAYFVGEETAGTTSTKAWDQVTLVAKKLMAITPITSELSEDAVINVADDIVNEIAYAFAYKEDYCGFLGDGTSTYGGIIGVSTRLKSINGVDDGGGLVLGAGNTFAELTLANHNKVVSICPSYARQGAKWFCSPTYFDQVMSKLAYAAGGNTVQTVTGGIAQSFLGYPVVLSDILPTSDANGQVACLFGNLAQAASLGDRRSTTIAFSDSATVGSINMFETDQIAVKGTERIDIAAHDLGDATTAGPVVGLITASS